MVTIFFMGFSVHSKGNSPESPWKISALICCASFPILNWREKFPFDVSRNETLGKLKISFPFSD